MPHKNCALAYLITTFKINIACIQEAKCPNYNPRTIRAIDGGVINGVFKVAEGQSGVIATLWNNMVITVVWSEVNTFSITIAFKIT